MTEHLSSDTKKVLMRVYSTLQNYCKVPVSETVGFAQSKGRSSGFDTDGRQTGQWFPVAWSSRRERQTRTPCGSLAHTQSVFDLEKTCVTKFTIAGHHVGLISPDRSSDKLAFGVVNCSLL